LFFPYIPLRLSPTQTGIDFIAQLGVDNEELPATLVAASQKLFTHSDVKNYADASVLDTMLFPPFVPS
jgi:hypothetical protein